LYIIKQLVFLSAMSTIPFDLRQIKSVVFDVDGVLSPDMIPLHPSGEPMRVINTKDGYAMQLAIKQGLVLGIITGGDTIAVRKRFESLGFQHIYLKARYKMDALLDFLQKTGLAPGEICYVGDDIPDYEVMQHVGLAACPADAAPEIKSVAQYISHKNGGQGVGRDIIEQILKAQGKWLQSDAFGW
jgi:3-deoxy-D-manno-octulosonate 8-phosphate phosphatase (KDO 8-P phosphatase)